MSGRAQQMPGDDGWAPADGVAAAGGWGGGCYRKRYMEERVAEGSGRIVDLRLGWGWGGGGAPWCRPRHPRPTTRGWVGTRRAQRLPCGQLLACPSPPPDLHSAFPAKLAGQGPPSHIFELAAKAPLQLLYKSKFNISLVTWTYSLTYYTVKLVLVRTTDTYSRYKLSMHGDLQGEAC